MCADPKKMRGPTLLLLLCVAHLGVALAAADGMPNSTDPTLLSETANSTLVAATLPNNLIVYELSLGAAIAIAIVGSIIITALVVVMFYFYDNHEPFLVA